MKIKERQWWEPIPDEDIPQEIIDQSTPAAEDACAQLLERIRKGEIKLAKGHAHGGTWIGR